MSEQWWQPPELPLVTASCTVCMCVCVFTWHLSRESHTAHGRESTWAGGWTCEMDVGQTVSISPPTRCVFMFTSSFFLIFIPRFSFSLPQRQHYRHPSWVVLSRSSLTSDKIQINCIKGLACDHSNISFYYLAPPSKKNLFFFFWNGIYLVQRIKWKHRWNPLHSHQHPNAV